jgi:hypothetical protein
MRFGQFVWAPVNDDHVKLHATLVDQSFDENSNVHGIMDPEFGNLMRAVAATSERLKVLGDLLVAKGVLTEQDKAQFVDVEDHAIRERLHQLQRVADVDRWFDGGVDAEV